MTEVPEVRENNAPVGNDAADRSWVEGGSLRLEGAGLEGKDKYASKGCQRYRTIEDESWLANTTDGSPEFPA